MRVLAVDWSAKLKSPEEFLGQALAGDQGAGGQSEAHDGELVRPENGRGRTILLQDSIEDAPPVTFGLVT